jgi:L-seryl-tRNA(Ser) seleniumtransferase
LTLSRIYVEMTTGDRKQAARPTILAGIQPFASVAKRGAMPSNVPDAAASGLLRQIPAVDELLSRASIRAAEGTLGRRALLEATRQVLRGVRARIASGVLAEVSLAELDREILAAAESSAKYSLQPVINATGVILHTNLGRAPLPRQAIERMAEVAGRYSNLEYDLDRGERGKRDAHTDRLFSELLGVERALIVNNNAAAVFLVLNSLAEGGEVIVSRGELIEIGGSFRIPDICAKSGSILKEVGTTNRTRLTDYAAAISEHTRALMRVHPSNFRVVGFTERPPLDQLVELAHRHHLPLIEDLGSGCVVDLMPRGISDEPQAGGSIRAGVDAVTFSGDKLLGGPQAGVIVGRRERLEPIRKNPLFRALRVDKLTIAALEVTLRLYLDGKTQAIPAQRMIEMTGEEIGSRAAHLAERIAALPGFSATLEDGESVIGGGSTPGQSLPTRLVAVRHARRGASELEALLRHNPTPVIARVERDRLMLDLRTVFEDQDEEIAQAFGRLAIPSGGEKWK